MRFGMRGGLAAAAVALICSGAQAADNLIPGKIHIIKPTLVKMVSKPVGAFTVPAPASAGDPTANGGSLDVFDTGGGGMGFSTTLPAGQWKGLGNPAGTKGYKYKGAGTPADPCKVVLVKSTVIKFVCKDAQNLNPPLAGTSGVILGLGADNYCAEFGGQTIKNQTGLLKRKLAPAPGACPAIAACCNGASFSNFSTTAGTGTCGTFSSSSMNNNIDCGGLYFGGGGNSVPLPALVPDLGSATWAITSCVGQAATLGATTSAQTGSNRTCTAAGCLFGAPLAVPNATTPPTSTCVLNLVATNGMGTLDCSTGAQAMDLPLSSIIYLTGDTATDPGASITGIQPCPLCSGGTCIGGPNNGMACTPGTTALNAAYPTSHDCPPDPMFDIGTLPIAFSLTSGTVTWEAAASGTQARVFSGFCRDADDTGAFESPAVKCFENGMAIGACGGTFEACEQRTQGGFGPNGNGTSTITAIGSPAAGILTGPAAGTLVSIFSIPPTFNATVDAAGDLPGPGAVALPGAADLCADAMACP